MLERRLPNLDLLELIGIGGAAEVYRALDANGRQVAVKILSERAEDDLIKRFLREGRVLSGLHHPHIVAIHEMGEAHGLRYLVMELVEGGSLKERLEAGPLPWPEAVEIARQIADALGYAHRRGIVHRDVKPGNIMFTADGSAKLADFGLAHLSDASAMTRTGTIMGTVFYLAPEQCLGHPIDARADLYALGAVLYEMLVGQPPFVGPTAVSIIYKHLNEQPPPLRDRDPSLPPLLEAIVSRLLQKDPSRRFPDAEALIDALAQVDHVSTNALPAEEAVAFILSPAESGQRDKGYLETGAELPLVGRAELFDALIAALDDACAGLGTTVLLAGEAGMGKTRLIHELMREAQRRNVLALCGECLYADAPDPYAPFVSMLRRFEEQGGYVGLEQSGGETASRKQPLRDVLNDLRAILRLGGALEPAGEVPLAGRARWLAQESPRDAQAHFFELIVQFFLLLSQERPLLLILDDLQWAGETVAQLFHYLARSLSRSRILLLGAYRPEEIRSNAEEMPLREVLRRMSREHLYREERLQALSCDDVASMLAMVLWPSGEMGAKVMPREFVYLLHRESEGNPFFLLEMLRLLAEEGQLVWCDDHWEPNEALWAERDPLLDRSVSIPQTVLDLILRRLEKLGADTCEVLDWAAVLGPRIDVDILALVSGQRRLVLLRQLHSLERDHGLLVADEEGFSFQHAIVQHALYHELPPLLRRECHQLIAEAIEQTCSQVEEQVYELARHYGLAEKVDKAYRYYRLAAAKAEASYAIGEAYAYLRRAARLLERITCEPHGEKQGEVFRARERLDLDRGQGRLLLTLGDSEKALQAFTRALETAQELADPRQEAQSLLDLAVANGRAGDWETAADLGRQSLELARASDSEHPETLPLAPQVLLSSGFFAFERGAWQEAKDSLQAALVMIDDLSSGGLSQALETGLVALRARILGNLGILYDAQGEHTKALDYFHSAADIFASLDLPLDEGRALNNLGYVYYRLGQHDKATTCFEAALARFEKVGDVREQAIAHLHLAETALAQARLADTQARRDVLHISRAHCAEATRRFNRSGYALGLADVDRVYAGLAQLEGRWAVAERYLRDALAVYEEHGDRLNLAETHAELGHLLQAMGQENQAHEALSRSRTEFSSLLGDREDTLN